MERPDVARARRIVIKLGTRVLTHDGGQIALSRLFAVVEAAAGCRAAGREVLLVSSGAVGLGRGLLGLDDAPAELADRQACAAVGQAQLMSLYQAGFTQLGLTCAQVLLTQGDFDDRLRYLNLRDALAALLRRGVVPVINENDVVSTEELAWAEGGGSRPIFGDNDRLAALVATKLDAELLVLLTDVEGVYDRDPRAHPDAALLARIDADGVAQAGGPTAGGRGGMRSKVESARVAARSGCHAIIASGRASGALAAALAGAGVGTWFPARPGLPARHRWIAFAAAPRGALHLDAGAVRALRERGASLLAAGVRRVEGAFERGDVVELLGPDGARVGRGMVHCGRDAAAAWIAGARPASARNHHALVHRDHLVLEDS